LKALTLPFKGQQMYTLTNFAIAGNQSFVTTLLYYKLNLRPIHIKSTLC